MKKATAVKKEYRIDATGKVLGRLASDIVAILRGKNRPDFAPNKESGNLVIISNVGKMKITGKKLEQKTYFKHTGYLGKDQHNPMGKIFEKNPGEILRRAVMGMLPKNKLRDRQIKMLKFEK